MVDGVCTSFVVGEGCVLSLLFKDLLLLVVGVDASFVVVNGVGRLFIAFGEAITLLEGRAILLVGGVMSSSSDILSSGSSPLIMRSKVVSSTEFKKIQPYHQHLSRYQLISSPHR